MTQPEIDALLAVAEAAQDLESLLDKRPHYDWPAWDVTHEIPPSSSGT
jgi:hypothetical protein